MSLQNQLEKGVSNANIEGNKVTFTYDKIKVELNIPEEVLSEAANKGLSPKEIAVRTTLASKQEDANLLRQLAIVQASPVMTATPRTAVQRAIDTEKEMIAANVKESHAASPETKAVKTETITSIQETPTLRTEIQRPQAIAIETPDLPNNRENELFAKMPTMTSFAPMNEVNRTFTDEQQNITPNEQVNENVHPAAENTVAEKPVTEASQNPSVEPDLVAVKGIQNADAIAGVLNKFYPTFEPVFKRNFESNAIEYPGVQAGNLTADQARELVLSNKSSFYSSEEFSQNWEPMVSELQTALVKELGQEKYNELSSQVPSSDLATSVLENYVSQGCSNILTASNPNVAEVYAERHQLAQLMFPQEDKTVLDVLQRGDYVADASPRLNLEATPGVAHAEIAPNINTKEIDNAITGAMDGVIKQFDISGSKMSAQTSWTAEQGRELQNMLHWEVLGATYNDAGIEKAVDNLRTQLVEQLGPKKYNELSSEQGMDLACAVFDNRVNTISGNVVMCEPRGFQCSSQLSSENWGKFDEMKASIKNSLSTVEPNNTTSKTQAQPMGAEINAENIKITGNKLVFSTENGQRNFITLTPKEIQQLSKPDVTEAQLKDFLQAKMPVNLAPAEQKNKIYETTTVTVKEDNDNNVSVSVDKSQKTITQTSSASELASKNFEALVQNQSSQSRGLGR